MEMCSIIAFSSLSVLKAKVTKLSCILLLKINCKKGNRAGWFLRKEAES